MNWLPIKSAPKDGTWILVKGGKDYARHPVAPCVVAFWDTTFPEPGWAYAFWDGDWRSCYEDATHWSPIPA